MVWDVIIVEILVTFEMSAPGGICRWKQREPNFRSSRIIGRRMPLTRGKGYYKPESQAMDRKSMGQTKEDRPRNQIRGE